MRSSPIVREKRFPLSQMITIGLLPAPLKNIYYRWRGHAIGRGVKIGIGTVLIGDNITIEEGTQIGFATIIIGRNINIGRYVQIGALSYINVNFLSIDDDARVNNQVFVGGIEFPDSELRLGKRTIVMENTILNPTRPLIIGDDTGIGGRCSIFTHGSWQSELDGYPVTFAPVTLGNNVWVPWDVFIMPGVTIGDNVTLGAASLIVKDIPANSVAVGSPAKIIKTAEQRPGRPSQEERHKLFLKYIEMFNDLMKSYKMTTSLLSSHEGVWVYQYAYKRENYHLYYVDGSSLAKEYKVENLLADSLFVSLGAISDEKSSMLTSQGLMWLDLENKKRSRLSVAIGEQFSQFLSRYGVRFDDTIIF